MLRCQTSQPISRNISSTGRCLHRRRVACTGAQVSSQAQATRFRRSRGLAFILLGGVTVWSLARDSAPRPKLTEGYHCPRGFRQQDRRSGVRRHAAPGLSVELQQSPFLTLISDTTVQQTLALMGQPKARLTRKSLSRSASEPPARLSWKVRSHVLEANIHWAARKGLQHRKHSGSAAGGSRQERGCPELSQRDVAQFRTRVGESLATVERHSTPLAEATTPSIEALKAYSTGIKCAYPPGMKPYLSSGEPSKSIPSSHRA